MEFFCQILNGKLETTRNIDQQFNELKDGRYKVTIEKANKRSLPQNKYLWSCVYPTAVQGFRNRGYDEIRTAEDVHEIFKYKFIKKMYVSKDTGECFESPTSTKKLTTTEFMEYIEDIAKFCAENLHVVILPPNTQSSFMYAI